MDGNEDTQSLGWKGEKQHAMKRLHGSTKVATNQLPPPNHQTTVAHYAREDRDVHAQFYSTDQFKRHCTLSSQGSTLLLPDSNFKQRDTPKDVPKSNIEDQEEYMVLHNDSTETENANCFMMYNDGTDNKSKASRKCALREQTLKHKMNRKGIQMPKDRVDRNQTSQHKDVVKLQNENKRLREETIKLGKEIACCKAKCKQQLDAEKKKASNEMKQEMAKLRKNINETQRVPCRGHSPRREDSGESLLNASDDLKLNLQKHVKENKKLKEHIKYLESENGDYERELDDTKHKYKEEKLKIGTCIHKLESCKEASDEMNMKLSGEITVLREKKHELETQNIYYYEQAKKYKRQAESLSLKLCELEKERKGNTTVGDEYNFDNIVMTNKQLDQENKRLTAEVRTLHSKVALLNESIKQLKIVNGKCVELEYRLKEKFRNDLQVQKDAYDKDIKRLKNEISVISQDKVNRGKENHNLQQEVHRLSKNIKNLRVETEQYKREHETLRETIDGLNENMCERQAQSEVLERKYQIAIENENQMTLKVTKCTNAIEQQRNDFNRREQEFQKRITNIKKERDHEISRIGMKDHTLQSDNDNLKQALSVITVQYDALKQNFEVKLRQETQSVQENVQRERDHYHTQLENKDLCNQTEIQQRKWLEEKVYNMNIENDKRMQENQLTHRQEKERIQSKVDQLRAQIDDLTIQNGKFKKSLEHKDDEHAKQIKILNSELRSRLHSSKQELEKEQDKRIKVIKDKQEMDKEIYNMEIERSRQQERERYEREICSLSEQVQRLSELQNQAFKSENNYELIKRLEKELETKDVTVQTETQHRKRLEEKVYSMKNENVKRMEEAQLAHHKEKERQQSKIDQLTAKVDDLNRECVTLKNALEQKDDEHAKQVSILNSELRSRLHSSKQELEKEQDKRIKVIKDKQEMDKEIYNMEIERSRQQERERYEREICSLSEQVQRLSELQNQAFKSKNNYELIKRLEKELETKDVTVQTETQHRKRLEEKVYSMKNENVKRMEEAQLAHHKEKEQQQSKIDQLTAKVDDLNRQCYSELIKSLGEELEKKEVIVQTETQHRKRLEERLSNMKIENDKHMEDAHLAHHKEKARNQSDIDQLTAKDDDLNRQCVKLKNALEQKDDEHAKQVRILNSELSRLHSSKQELETQQEKRVKGIMGELAMDKEMYNMEVERSRQQERQRYESEISKLNEQVQRLSELPNQAFESENNYDVMKRLETELEKKNLLVQTETQNRKRLEEKVYNMEEENDKRMKENQLTNRQEKELIQSTIVQLRAKVDDLNRQCVKLKNALKQKDDEHAKQVEMHNRELRSRLHSCKQELEKEQDKRIKVLKDELEMGREKHNLEIKRLRQQERERYEREISTLTGQVQWLSKPADQAFESEDYYELKRRLEKANVDLKDARQELDETKTRLSKLMGQKLTDNNPNIADLSDKNRPTKLAERFTELYDNQWTDAFEIVDNGNEQDTIARLLEILNESMKYCGKESNEQMKSLRAVVVMSESMSGESDTISDLLNKQLKDCRKAAVDVSAKHLYKKYVASLRISGSDALRVQAFLKECFEVCWLMSIQDPPVVLGPELKHGDPFNADIYKAYTTSGPTVDYVVWPALYLYRGGAILCKGVAQGYGARKKKQR